MIKTCHGILTLSTLKKITRNIGILRRPGNTVPQHSLITLYKTLIEPYFRCCSIVWGYCNDSLIKKLQTLQNRAVRIVTLSKYETANHPQLLKDLEWLSVHNLIKFDTAALMYKVHNEIVPDPIVALFDKTEAIHKYSTRSVTNQNYVLKRTNLNKERYFGGSCQSFIEAGKSFQRLNLWKYLNPN